MTNEIMLKIIMDKFEQLEANLKEYIRTEIGYKLDDILNTVEEIDND